MIFTKADASNSDEKVKKLTRILNNHHRACIDSLICFFYKSGLGFCSAQVRKVFSKPGKLHFEGLVHLLRYIRDNKTLRLKYYGDMNDASLSELLKQVIIITENQSMEFYDSSWQDCPDTGRSTRAYTIFY